MFPHPIYHITSIPVEVTYIFHISTWNFLCMLKNFNRRMDILVWIFHVSTSNLSCHLYTRGGDIHIPHFYMEFLCVLKNFNKGMDILVWIFHVFTSNSSCHLYTGGGDLYIPHFYMKFFMHDKKLQQEDGHPSIDFPCFHI